MSEYEQLLERIHRDLDRLEGKLDKWADKVEPALTDIALLKADARRTGAIHGWIAGVLSGAASAWLATKLFF